MKHHLCLHSFRCHRQFEKECGTSMVCVTGHNGSGKTSLLEALSFFSPGKGLRQAFLADVCYQQEPQEPQAALIPWRIQLFLEDTFSGPLKLEAIYDPTSKKRLLYANEEPLRTQMALTDWLTVSWLTPSMDRLWTEGWTCRRHYLNRLVFTLRPAYASILLHCEKLLRERLQLLTQHHNPSSQWLDSLEHGLAKAMVHIHEFRCSALNELEKKMALWIPVTFGLQGTLESLLEESAGQKASRSNPLTQKQGFQDSFFFTNSTDSSSPSSEEESKIALVQNALRMARSMDTKRKVSTVGPQRTHFQIFYSNGKEATLCSTGEQKKILTFMTLALATKALEERPGQPHFLLLDELPTHLDDETWKMVSSCLCQLNCYLWMTSSDPHAFRPLSSFLETSQRPASDIIQL